MALEISESIARQLAERNSSAARLADYQAFTVDAGSAQADLTPEQRRGAFADLAPWQLSRPSMFARVGAWGTCWSEMSSATTADGHRILIPDVDTADPEIVAHWIWRAEELGHPVLRGRYADVAWEMGRYLRKRGKAIGDRRWTELVVPSNSSVWRSRCLSRLR